MTTSSDERGLAYVDLYWLPLGAGEATGVVRRSGYLFESLAACRGHRSRRNLYHSALEVGLPPYRVVIEMAPVWGNVAAERGVVAEGPVGLPWLGRSRLFRYEVRRWLGGAIQDAAFAVASPIRLSADRGIAARLLALVPAFPTMTWGRDESRADDMWNSNSLTSWLLARSGHNVGLASLPRHGRAPGWTAGLVVADRDPSIRRPFGPMATPSLRGAS